MTRRKFDPRSFHRGFRRRSERGDELGGQVGQGEGLGQHAHHRGGHAIEGERRAEHGRGPAEPVRPEAVADDHDRGSTRVIVGRLEHPAQGR